MLASTRAPPAPRPRSTPINTDRGHRSGASVYTSESRAPRLEFERPEPDAYRDSPDSHFACPPPGLHEGLPASLRVVRDGIAWMASCFAESVADPPSSPLDH